MRRILAILAMIFFASLIHNSHPTRASAFHSATNPAPNPYDLVAEVNALRAANGLAAYNTHPILMSIAQAHSEYQASLGTWTHIGTDGSRPFERALAAGYPVAGDLSLGGWFSENVAAGNFSVADVISLWMGDAPHRNTMLSATLRDVGAGIAVSGNTIYYTLDASLASSDQPTTWLTASPARMLAPPKTPTSTLAPATPREDGAVIHLVRAGDTLWSIAQTYGVSEDDIKRLNNLTSNTIFPDDRLTIVPPFTPTPTLPTPTNTRRPTATPWPTSTSTLTLTPTVTPKPPHASMPLTWGIGVVALIALLALGIAGAATWSSSRKEKEE